VDLIYSSHTLEYFDREEVVDVLKEWYRVLKPDGKLYLSVPDFRAMADLYVKKNIPLHKFLGPLYGKRVSDFERGPIYHKTVYDYASLGELLRFIGFRKIEPWVHQRYEVYLTEGDSTEVLNFDTEDDCSNAFIHDRLISLNISCKK